MIKINLKIQFILLLVSLFFVGLGIETIIEEKAYSGVTLLKQISHLGPFIISSIILIRNIYYKGKKNNIKYNSIIKFPDY
ncbi:hypothetical protein [Chryseobacterium carnipullorum]|uniref:Uncharacterized protein n=1 Tax=Chryseobacterium carnipullorum TaxID=1124835 RepID=A0A376EPD6_CHRCU|nr:hypothetical protein [Chryseobacterium carnipullorum]AZA67073.1 hypothetical protein EG345_22050 [Chryseobacterium carnipullorum]STD11724.1 Uncharacterised protein [Chryseobacterium carnipullorum]